MTATTALRLEHERILAVIACLRAACRSAQASGRIDAETFRQAIDFIRGYADAWHHAKEEEHLFPALVAMGLPREGGPVGVMLHEHELGRAHARAMADNLDAAADGHAAAVDAVIRHGVGYAELLEGHIRKENGILFEMADRILSEEEHARLEQAYRTSFPVWDVPMCQFEEAACPGNARQRRRGGRAVAGGRLRRLQRLIWGASDASTEAACRLNRTLDHGAPREKTHPRSR